jgi:hypothetical protein
VRASYDRRYPTVVTIHDLQNATLADRSRRSQRRDSGRIDTRRIDTDHGQTLEHPLGEGQLTQSHEESCPRRRLSGHSPSVRNLQARASKFTTLSRFRHQGVADQFAARHRPRPFRRPLLVGFRLERLDLRPGMSFAMLPTKVLTRARESQSRTNRRTVDSIESGRRSRTCHLGPRRRLEPCHTAAPPTRDRARGRGLPLLHQDRG